MFVGDFIMPYLGAPFVEEGDFQGLLDAIDIVVAKHPQYLLHGHEPLTRNFASVFHAGAAQNGPGVASRAGIERDTARRGTWRNTPGKFDSARICSGASRMSYLPYLILREHVIDRLYDQNVGYWQPDLQGLDHLSSADRAELLVDYLGVYGKSAGEDGGTLGRRRQIRTRGLAA